MPSKSTRKEPEPKVPADLRKVLAASALTAAQWKDLTTIARWDFIGWIESAKQPETRMRRIERVPDMLATGKRRPCCYAVVPMDLYRALGTDTEAKAQWSKLTPIERRNFTRWVESSKAKDERKSRIEKACAMLAAGKQRP